MQFLPSSSDAREQLADQVQSVLAHIKSCADSPSDSLADNIELLGLLRRNIYEHLNQIQHRALLLDAAEYLEERYDIVEWWWHPEQTGTANEPDLRGINALGEVVVSAEASASHAPIGSIDKHMRNTLTSLSGMGGKMFYFARTAKMVNRAATKISKMVKCTIEVVKL